MRSVLKEATGTKRYPHLAGIRHRQKVLRRAFLCLLCRCLRELAQTERPLFPGRTVCNPYHRGRRPHLLHLHRQTGAGGSGEGDERQRHERYLLRVRRFRQPALCVAPGGIGCVNGHDNMGRQPHRACEPRLHLQV